MRDSRFTFQTLETGRVPLCVTRMVRNYRPWTLRRHAPYLDVMLYFTMNELMELLTLQDMKWLHLFIPSCVKWLLTVIFFYQLRCTFLITCSSTLNKTRHVNSVKQKDGFGCIECPCKMTFRKMILIWRPDSITEIIGSV